MRETQKLLIAVGRRSNLRPSRIRGLLHFFLLHFVELFFVVFSLVFAKRSFALVLIVLADLVDKQKQNNPARSLYSHEIHQNQKIPTAFSRHSWYLIFLGKQKKTEIHRKPSSSSFFMNGTNKKNCINSKNIFFLICIFYSYNQRYLFFLAHIRSLPNEPKASQVAKKHVVNSNRFFLFKFKKVHCWCTS